MFIEFGLKLFIMMEYVIMLETKWEVNKKSQGKKVNNLIGLVWYDDKI